MVFMGFFFLCHIGMGVGLCKVDDFKNLYFLDSVIHEDVFNLRLSLLLHHNKYEYN